MTPDYLKGSIVIDSSNRNSTEKESNPEYLKGSKPFKSKKESVNRFLGQEFKDLAFSPEETPFEKGLGTAIRGTASVGLGFPGNIAQLTKKAGKGVYDFIQPLLGLPESSNEEGMRLLPTTTDVEKGFDIATEGRFAPTEEEKPYYEAAQDIVSMFMPGSGPLKAWQRIGIPIAGQLTKEGIKTFGGKETAQELGKTGMTFALSVASLANGEKYASNLLQQSESLMPSGKMIDAKPVESIVNKLKGSTWFRGADIPSTRPAKQLIKAIEENISNGQIEGQMAVELRKNANEIQKNLGAFDIFSKSDKKKAILHLNQAKEAVMEGLEHYGKTQDPQFWKLNQEANRAYATIARSKVIKNFIEKHAPGLKSKTAKGLFGTGALGAAGTTLLKAPMIGLGATTGAVTGMGTIKSLQILYRVMQDPKLRKYYINTLEYAAKENSKAMASNLQKLDELLQKEED